MNILYITDVNYIGKFSEDFSFGYRPFMSWVAALDATHCSYYRLNELNINNKFDIAIVGSLNSTLLQDNIDLNILILEKIKPISKKIIVQQESYHRSFIHDSIDTKKDINTLISYYNFLSQCDAILTHNDIDTQYFSNLLNKPCFLHPQLIIPIEDLFPPDFDKPNNFILSTSEMFRDKGGALDGYLLVKDFNLPIYTFGDIKTNLPLLNSLPYNSDYREFNTALSKFKIGINTPFLPIGGSFPLQCAMVKVPCVGWDSGETIKNLFPDLVCEYPNFNKLKEIINRLLNDKEFYIDVVEKGYNLFLEKYSFESYYNQMSNILNQINKHE
jgi:glycosyltransferase involved in cell wall biosynthesis